MVDAPDEPDVLGIDLWAMIEVLSANPHIPPADLAQIQDIHAMFERVGSAFADNEPVMDALGFAFGYGTLVGSFIATRDPTLLRKIVELQQRLKGKKSGEMRREPSIEIVRKLAVTIRGQNPTLSRAKLGGKVADCWGKGALSLRMIERYLINLEKKGELPKAQPMKGPKFS